MKDGWHTILGWEVYVENGNIFRGIDKEKTYYPYRWNKKYNCWVNDAPLSVGVFRAGMNRGTIKMA